MPRSRIRVTATSLALLVSLTRLSEAQSNSSRGLTYQGWHAGMPMDSARTLGLRDTGKQLACFTLNPADSFCTASSDHVSVNIGLSLDGKEIESVEITRDVPPAYRRDALRKQLTDVWGAPDSLTAIREREPANRSVTATWYGHWNSGKQYAYAYEVTGRQTRSIRIKVADRDALVSREERLGLRQPPLDRFKP